MKKKVMMIGAGLTIGSALLVSSAFADIGGAKGYDAYKSAVKQTATVTNATQHVALSLKDNGKELLHVQGIVKENKTSKTASGNFAIQAGGTSQTFDFYDQSGQKVFKPGSSDTYSVIAEQHRNRPEGLEEKSGHDGMPKEVENVVDALVGNLKNYVSLNNASGGEQAVDVRLTGSQIPAAANAIGSLLVKEALSGKHQSMEADNAEMGKGALGVDFKQVIAQFPKLTQDVNIDSVGMHATIGTDQYIHNQKVDITITGKDDAGAAHQVVLSADVDLTDLNSTTPDAIDLTGKKVNTIQDRHFND